MNYLAASCGELTLVRPRRIINEEKQDLVTPPGENLHLTVSVKRMW
jgi:hypothetical protein